jgi:hypothetical protein
VPLLFTPHAALLLRCGEWGGFVKVPHFWYRGEPRAVRVWDEHLSAAFPLTLDPEMGLRLIRYMRRLDPNLADQFHEDMNELKAWPEDTLYQLRDYSIEFGVDPEDLYRCAPNLAEDQATALAVCKLQGQVGVVRRDNFERGTTILFYAENLSPDLPPMVICDANGRFASPGPSVFTFPLVPTVSRRSPCGRTWCGNLRAWCANSVVRSNHPWSRRSPRSPRKVPSSCPITSRTWGARQGARTAVPYTI